MTATMRCVVIQVRATVTRRKIIDTAVELFTDEGYGEVGLNRLLDAAGVTTGAFYYHFPSKSSLARAIIDQGWPQAVEVLDDCLGGPRAGLENVILMSFSLSALMKRDKLVWLANHLNQAFGQLSEVGRRDFKDHAQEFVARVATAVRSEDIRSDVSPEEVGNLVWITIHGCHLLSDAMSDDVIDRLSRSWHALLRAIVAEESLPYFEQYLRRTAAQYGAAAMSAAG